MYLGNQIHPFVLSLLGYLAILKDEINMSDWTKNKHKIYHCFIKVWQIICIFLSIVIDSKWRKSQELWTFQLRFTWKSSLTGHTSWSWKTLSTISAWISSITYKIEQNSYDILVIFHHIYIITVNQVIMTTYLFHQAFQSFQGNLYMKTQHVVVIA